MTSTPDPIAAEASAQYGAADERGPATPAAVLPALRGNEENWVNQPADKKQSPIVQAGNLKESNGSIQTWDGSAPLTLTNPDGSDIRSLYFPNLPNPVTVFVGPASATAGGVWTTSESSEVVLLPTAINVVTVTASKPFGKSVQVFATNDVLSPIAPYVTIVGDIATVSTSPYPKGAVPFELQLSGEQWFTGATTSTLATPSLAAGQQIYLTKLLVRGLEIQRYAYTLNVLDPVLNVMFACTFNSGLDLDADFSPPIQIPTSTHAGIWALQLTSSWGDAIIGTLNLDGIIGGYYI